MKIQLLNYWIGKNPLPKWRADNVLLVKQMHPDIEVIDVWDKADVKNPQFISDEVRFNWISEAENRLWIDSDIELLNPLPLGDRPACAFETMPHHSILWSGNRPDLFKRVPFLPVFEPEDENIIQSMKMSYRLLTLKNLHKKGEVDYYHPEEQFYHWATAANGHKTERQNLGYKKVDK